MSDEIADELDIATRRALIELVRRHPDRTLGELLEIDGAGPRIASLTVRELMDGQARRTETAAPPRGPAPRAADRGRRDREGLEAEVLASVRALGGRADMRALKARLADTSDDRLVHALQGLCQRGALTIDKTTKRLLVYMLPADDPTRP